MASRFARFSGWTKKVIGRKGRTPAARPSAGPQVVQLEDRSVPATFVVTNILDNQVDVVGGYSLRQAILAANASPGFDRITFNIPSSPSLPKRTDGTNYFPIILASTLPDLTDPSGLEIDANTQPRPQVPDFVADPSGATLVDDPRPAVQLLPDPNPGAFPGSRGAFYITGKNNVIRGFVITGFPGSAITVAGGKDNIFLGNYINTDIEGTKAWFQDQLLSKFRRAGLPDELTNDERGTVLAGLTFLGSGTGSTGAQGNIVGGLYDFGGSPLVNPEGTVIGIGGKITRNDGSTIDVTEATNRNIIAGTPEYRRDFTQIAGLERDITGAGSGAGIRFMDPFTRGNLVQGNFIGTSVPDANGNVTAIPNENAIEFYSGASSNFVGNPSKDGPGTASANLIRFNRHDGVRVAPFPNFARPDQVGPGTNPLNPFRTLDVTIAETAEQANLPRYYDAYSPNYYDGSPTGGAPRILQLGIPNPNGAAPAYVPGIVGSVGQTITINGRNLLGLTGVAFRGPNGTLVPAKFTVIDDGTVTVIVPAGVVTGPVRLISPGGTTDSPDDFNLLPSPAPQLDLVSTFTPAGAKVGETVTITGTNFFGATGVRFGQQGSQDFTVSADGKTITAVVPSGASTGFITIDTPGGTVSTLNQFQVFNSPPPNITGYSTPSAVPGQTITITGNGFTGTRSIIFNFTGTGSGFSTSDVTVVDDNTIRVKVPLSATPSNGPVQIIGAGGNAVSPAALSFRILPPAAVSISGFEAQPPGAVTATSGPVGTRVLIRGAGFTSAVGVVFGAVSAPRFTVLDDGTIEAFVPQGGNGPITVSVPGRQVTSRQSFTVTPTGPTTVTSVQAGRPNTFVTIRGTNLLGTQFVRFGSNSPVSGLQVDFPNIKVIDNTTIQVLVPLAAADGNVFVFTPSAPNGVVAPFDLVNPAPPTINTAKLADPRSGTPGTKITFTGQGLLGTQQVLFTAQGGGTVEAEFTVVNDRTVTATVPFDAATGPVQIVTPGGTDGTTIDFIVTVAPRPVITGYAPTTVQVGTSVTITGRNFTSAQTVTFGGIPLTRGSFDVPGQFEVLSDDQIRLRVPNGASGVSGQRLVTVQVPGSSATSPVQYTLVASPAPTIAFVAPGGARNSGVVIQGTGLLGTVSVQFNGVPSTKITINSDRQIVAVVPPNATSGVVTVTTPGGVAISQQVFQVLDAGRPVFNSQIGDPNFLPDDGGVPSSGLPDLEIPAAGPLGSRLFIRGTFYDTVTNTGLLSVYRVEFSGPLGPIPAEFQRLVVGGQELIMATVPDGAVTGSIAVFAAAKDAATGLRPGVAFGGKWDTSQYDVDNILGQRFVYGESYEVLPNPVPVVTAATFPNGVSVRGSYVQVTGSGFLGANGVTISGRAHTRGEQFFQANGDIDRNKLDYGEFVVVNDNTIVIKTATQGGVFDGSAAFTGTVVVTGPGGTSKTSADVAFGATQPLTFVTAGFVPTGASSEPGFPSYNGKPITVFWGSSVDIVAKTGTFFGTTEVSFAGFASPEFRVSDDGSTITAVIDGNIPIPDPPPPPPNVPPFTPQTPLRPLVRYIGNQSIPSADGGDSLRLLRTENPRVDALAPANSPTFLNNRDIVITGANLLGTTSVLFDVVDEAGNAFKVPIFRGDDRIKSVAGGAVVVTLPVGSDKTGFFYDRRINYWLTGGVTVVTQKGTAGSNFTPQAQPVPNLVDYVPRRVATIDNRVTGNAIFGNGAIDTDQALARTNGDFGIDYVTDFGRFRDPNTLWSFPVTQQGNEGRGGMEDRIRPDTQTYPAFPQSTYPNDFPLDRDLVRGTDAPLGVIGFEPPINPTFQFGFEADHILTYDLPNNMQNFPLLQVVQSSVDRTEFSTALISRAFTAYRIDYYLNPTFNNLDATADNTEISPYGQTWLGSRVITTDFQGNGSVSFKVYKPIPGPDGTVPPPAPDELRLPNDQPLDPNQTIVSTATDLSAPGPNGASRTTGPDGTSRFGFFRRVDNSTGGIEGIVVLDKNKNGVQEATETGAANFKVDLFVDRGDGTFTESPTVSLVTTDDGQFFFSQGGGLVTNGLGLPNGTHKIVVTPTVDAKDGQLISPADGTQLVTVQNGKLVTDVKFFVYETVTTTGGGNNGGGNNGGGNNGGGNNGGGNGSGNDFGPLTNALATGADAGGGPQVNVYNAADGSFRYSFLAYDSSFTGGVRVAVADVNGDGNQDIITAPGPGMPGLVKVFNGRTNELITSFQPYEDAFIGGLYVAAGDVTGETDGKAEIVTGTGEGGGPRVQVFRLNDLGTVDTINNFFPYEESFRGGVLVTAGDVNGDNRADIVTGTGVGGGPRVQVFDAVSLAPIYNFFAYESTFRGGVFASVGDVSGVGRAQILTGTGVGGGPVVKVFRQEELQSARLPEPTAVLSFFAYDPLFRGGVRVDSADANGDGRLDIITSAGPGNPPDVRALDFYGPTDIYRLQAYDPAFLGGVFVGGTHD